MHNETWTAYTATIIKHVPHGTITMAGNQASTVGEAKNNLAKTEAEYVATGAWGGSS